MSFESPDDYTVGCIYKMRYLKNHREDKNSFEIIAEVTCIGELFVEFEDIKVPKDEYIDDDTWEANQGILKNNIFDVVEYTKEKNPEYYL